ncbi:hypothetical protein TSMEX_011795 [Taenia solium]|eukprot:TsM_001195700 transcript=TsM_001195700 gene=TsM_001195700
MKEIDRSAARWYEELQQYDFTVQYKKGTMHSKPDALARRPLSAERESSIVGTLFLSKPSMHQWRNTQSTCPETALVSFKKPHSTAIAPLQSMPTGSLGERVGIDAMGPLPLTKRGNRYILVMVDCFTKVAEAEAMKSEGTETVASTFFNRWICQHGVLESIYSDQGHNFESRLFIEPCKTFGIAKTRTTLGHPQGNGQVERTIRALVGFLKAFTKEAKPEYWNLSLGSVLLAYRLTDHVPTGVSPFKMLTGREMSVPYRIFIPSKEAATDNVPEYVLRLKEQIRKMFIMARRHLQTPYSKQKKYYDKHSRPSTYQERNLVQIYKPIPPPGRTVNFTILGAEIPSV